MTATDATPTGRRARRLLVVVGVLAATLLGVELALRALLFHDLPGLERLGVRLRQPASFYARHEPEHWLLQAHFRAVRQAPPETGTHPTLGWVGPDIDRETFAHAAEGRVQGRRPVLLFGDSFARCTTERRDCWEGLLAGSELRASHVLLNYGVGGYGLDQIVLLTEAALARFLDDDPIVIVAILVDDDLDRATLPYRSRPKPRFVVKDGALVASQPLPVGIAPYLREHGPPATSLAWRFVARKLGLGERASVARHRAEVAELARAWLTRVQAHLDARGVDWFVALFHGEPSLAPPPARASWQEPLLAELLQGLGIPYVSSRPELLTAAEEAGGLDALFVQRGPEQGHYTPRGNAAVFPALERGIRALD